jgi:Flp pilus assembly protein TadG
MPKSFENKQPGSSMIFQSILDGMHRLRADKRGAVAVTVGVLSIPLIGALAIGYEVSSWYMVTRSMQNAADAATIAAATNGGANYGVEGKAVAASYGFVDGTNNVSVAVTNAAACPGGGNTCYSATVSSYVPLLMSRVLGVTGDGMVNGSLQKKLSAVAVAKAATKPEDICLLALASSGVAQGIRTNGAPTANMNGCNVMSNTAAQCNGSDLGAGLGMAHGNSNGCGATQVSNVPVVTDPYIGKASNIPPLSSAGCGGSYPKESKKGNTYTVAASNQLSGTLNLTAGNNFKCGDQMLTADTVITTPPGSSAVLIIENGQLDLNGHVLTTSNGSAVTLVFSGDNSGSYNHMPSDNTNGPGGRLDLAAPTSGPWSGVAIYQDPNLTSGLDVAAAGNSPTWNITGLVYMPHATITLKGAIDKATAGKSCLVMVADNFQISGTAGILKTDIGQCPQAGLTMPTAKIPGRSMLVL